jgi:hypothetical protein
MCEKSTTPTTGISEEDLALIDQIVLRALDTYGDRVKCSRLWAALKAAHRAKPIRLNDLLNTCNTDFYKDVFAGAYAHYRPATDDFKDSWTAQHAEPDEEVNDDDFVSFLNYLFGSAEEEEEETDW